MDVSISNYFVYQKDKFLNTNSCSISLMMFSGMSWLICVSIQAWNESIGGTKLYNFSQTGNFYNLISITSYDRIQCSNSNNTLNFTGTLPDRAIAYWNILSLRNY